MITASQTSVLLAISVASCAVAGGGGGWVDYADETATRMPTGLNDPALSVDDVQEKDYAVGDVDNDGDPDLVVVRKQPFTSTGKRQNVLFMNEGKAEGHAINGVLVDRTSDYAVASDVPGDNGFETPTNDRDVWLADLDGDGWLDMVTATTLTDNEVKHMSHPRVYMNLGEIGGVWQGFEHQDARIPQMHGSAGPRFCSVVAGDMDGDGDMDLYFGDYDSGGGQIFDYNNRLLINDGNGFFEDETNARLGSLYNYGGSVGFDTLAFSAFGAASAVGDMNGDDLLDVIKQTSLNAPTHVAITHNNDSTPGVFDASDYKIYDDNAPYFVTVGDLNNDGKLDMVVTDDGSDRYYLNQGNDGNNLASFTERSFGSISNGFGGDSYIADLNNDGHNDVIITDVDVDIPGCNRTTRIYRNLGNVPNVSLLVQGEVIPNGMLNGVHNTAVMDLNGDGWLDLVMGRCTGTQVWMNQPPAGLLFTFPSGVPSFLTPGETTDFTLQVAGIGGTAPEAGSAKAYLAVNGGPFDEISLADLGGDLYTVTLPAGGCSDSYEVYFSAETVDGELFVDPPAAPDVAYAQTVADGLELLLRDDLEGDTSGWTVENDGSLTFGAWEAVNPNGTIDSGNLAAPENDATAGAENVMCFVTENGTPGGPASVADIDGGPTHLISPIFDLSGTSGTVSFARWVYTNLGVPDALTVSISNDGGDTWVDVPEMTSFDTGGEWETVAFEVHHYVAPTSTMRVRFTACDCPNDSISEAGIDNFQVDRLLCPDLCSGDIDGDGVVNTSDLLALLAEWGVCGGCASDLNGSGTVDTADLLLVLAAWGDCP